MIDKQLRMYEKGAITADHLVSECLNRLDSSDPAAVLEFLPQAILMRILKYAQRFKPGHMISNHGKLPTANQVLAAKAWIETKLTIEGTKPTAVLGKLP